MCSCEAHGRSHPRSLHAFVILCGWMGRLLQMNRLIADGVASKHCSGDVIWVHGYELIVIAKKLRTRTTNSKIVRATPAFVPHADAGRPSALGLGCALPPPTSLQHTRGRT